MKPRLTPARKTALEVLAQAADDKASVFVSNHTRSQGKRRAIYWQSADWLLAHGYAEVSLIDRARVQITFAGRECLREVL